MKKITLFSFFIGGILFAQQPGSYANVETQNQINDANDQLAIITIVDNGRQPILDTYTSLVDFEDALDENCIDTTLTSENFEGGPSGITPCGPIVSDAGDGCFPAGELESGFDVQASNGSDVINIPSGAIGNIDSLVGASVFLEYTTINFSPNVSAVAMDLWENNDPTTTVRIYGDGGTLIETLTVIVPVNSQTFFGVIADEPISMIEIEGQNESGELFGNFLYGAECFLSVNDNVLSQLSLYPNPSSDIITINTPAGVEIESYTLYNLLGKVVLESNNNNKANLSELSSGVYIINIITDNGSISKKVIRK